MAAGGGPLNSDTILIDSNILNGGYYGIYIYGNSSGAYNNGIKIRNNVITNCYATGITARSIYNALDVMQNNIIMADITIPASVGITLFSCLNNSVNSHRITGNKISKASSMGIYLAHTGGTVSSPTKVSNNMICG